ncbi:hypothetical protein [Nibricoccus sp. IMCC34717]|uniref:hypothetical protein n=1 Tax=Nibricoccus sp. IMCC34717 TaxID=3034021 RepID=UPI00384EB23A
MKSHRLLLSTLVLSSGSGISLLAQEAKADAPVSDKDVPIRYIRPMRNTVSVGVRLTNSGGNVKFGNLGTIPRAGYDPKANVNTVGAGRVYDNGAVLADALSNLEKNPYVLNTAIPKLDSNGKLQYVKIAGVKVTTGTNGQEQREVVLPTGTQTGIDVSLILDTSTQVAANGDLPTADGRIYRQVRYVVYQRDDQGVLKSIQVPKLDASGNPVTEGGNPVTVPFTVGLPVLNSEGNITTELLTLGDYLQYQEAATRFWKIQNADQLLKDSQGRMIGIGLDQFGARTDGASFESKTGKSTGVEVSFEHLIRRESLRFEWGFKGTFGVSTINTKKAGTVAASLVRARDTFLFANPITAFDAKYDFTNGQRQYTYLPKIHPENSEGPEVETTVPLTTLPLKGENGEYTHYTYTAGAAQVNGEWQVKGASVNFRFGPSARFYFSPRFSVSGMVGVTANYYSTRYNIRESMTVPAVKDADGKILIPAIDVPAFDTSQLTAPNGQDLFDNTKKGVAFGPAAELNVEWWLTPSTGFYVGASYDKPSTYTQRIGSHFAKVDLGSGTAFRFGINTRF